MAIDPGQLTIAAVVSVLLIAVTLFFTDDIRWSERKRSIPSPRAEPVADGGIPVPLKPSVLFGVIQETAGGG